jgi:hypothetical protein
MQRKIDSKAARKLAERAPLPLDPSRSIAIKRDVHEFEVDTDCQTFARAFREVVTHRESVFGLIRVKRPGARLGRDFEVGERFQGCFSLVRAARGFLEKRRLGGMGGAVERLLSRPPAAQLVGWLEDHLLSNYAEIEAIVMEPDATRGEVHHLRYRYLDGTPIAGSSLFTIEPLGEARCRVKQVFEYQEVNGIALGTFQRFGLKYHDQVVHMQIHQAAARAGARALSGTIPRQYAEL